jgi:hypothetical protein
MRNWRRIGFVHRNYRRIVPVEYDVGKLLTKDKPKHPINNDSCPDYVVFRPHNPHAYVEVKTCASKNYNIPGVIISKCEKSYFDWLSANYPENPIYIIRQKQGGGLSEFRVFDYTQCEVGIDLGHTLTFSVNRYLDIDQFKSLIG